MRNRIVVRKARSAILKIWRKCFSLVVRIRIILFYTNIVIGRNVSFGRMVSLRTSEGGKIIIGNNVTVEDSCLFVAKKGTLVIRDNTYIGHGSHLCALEKVSIGEKCMIAAYSIIRDMTHGTDLSSYISEQQQEASPVVIENDVWLGAHVVVTSGVTIGSGTVVGANSVVTRDIESNKIAVGAPAKIVKNRGEK